MSEEKIFLVYRIYSNKERGDANIRSLLYGWSPKKSIVKAFLSQRTKGKYKVIKTYGDRDEIQVEQQDLDVNNMINYVKLKSAQTNEDFHLFMTADEMQEAEKRIQRYFRDLCSISEIKGDVDVYLEMFLNIEEYYADALDFIGYRPPEISAMFPSGDFRDDPGDIMGLDELIEEAYSGGATYPKETFDRYDPVLPGLSTLTDVATKILYSIESFVKVLRNDL